MIPNCAQESSASVKTWTNDPHHFYNCDERYLVQHPGIPALEENVKQKNALLFTVDRNVCMMRFFVFLALCVATLMIGFADADAATKKKQRTAKAAQTKPYSAIVVDATTGEVLMARQADSIRHPASLTKMMTLYMTFDAIEHGTIRMNDRIRISSHAASMSPSKLGLPVGSSIRVEDAIKAIVTKSANDVAAALGEKLAGSERSFATRMTRKAKELGMSRTNFRNASGLPDPQQVTTARDMAKLAMALLRDYPSYYHYFGVRNFAYNGSVHVNHNRLLGEYPGLDGIKTGYINASGFNLVASAKQNGRRLVGVVFGGRTWRSRNAHMVKLLDEGFAEIKRRGDIQVASINAPIQVPIPLPPPMMDDERGVNIPVIARDDETDSAEETIPYSPADAQKIISMIDQVQEQTEDNEKVIAAAPLPAPRPTLEIHQMVAVTPANENRTNNIATPPAGAARTVMQLRIPRSQLPKGIATSQIASSNPLGWSVQVGAFQSRAMTDQALRTAQSRLPVNLQHGQAVIVPQSTGDGLVFRARLQGYDEIQANAACAHLGSCLVVAPGS